MILTVTPNPSLDRTYEIPALDRGAVLRATADRIDPGGKGVNVSRAVAAAGHRTLAVLPLGGPAGAALAGLLGAEGIEVAGVQVAGQTRSNISVAEPDGTLTKINATGPELTADESEALLDHGRRALRRRRLDRLLRQSAARPGARVVRGAGRPRPPGRRPDRPGHLGPVADRGAARTPGHRQAERRGAGAGRRPPARDSRRRGQGRRGAAGLGSPRRTGLPGRGRPAPRRRGRRLLRQRPGRRRPQQCRRGRRLTGGLSRRGRYGTDGAGRRAGPWRGRRPAARQPDADTGRSGHVGGQDHRRGAAPPPTDGAGVMTAVREAAGVAAVRRVVAVPDTWRAVAGPATRRVAGMAAARRAVGLPPRSRPPATAGRRSSHPPFRPHRPHGGTARKGARDE